MRKESIFDELLLLRIHQGDNKAFELLVKRWNKRLLSFAYKYTKSTDASKDIVQEGWIAIYNGINKLKDSSKFSTWAFRIIYNKIMDWIKIQKKQQEFNDQIQQESLTEEEIEPIDITKYLEQLPTAHKAMLTLFYLEKQSIKQIAEILNVPAGTIKSRIFYAREKLKKIINNSNYENDR